MNARIPHLCIVFCIIQPLIASDTQEFLQAFERANNLFRTHNVPAAIEAYKSAIAICANYAEAHFNLGLAYERNNQIEEATIAYRKATTINPNSAKAHAHYGNALLQQKRYEEAIASLEVATQLDGSNIDAQLNLARAYAGCNMVDNARTTFLTILAAQPRHSTAMLELANMLNMHHYTEQALDWYLKLNEIVPNNASLEYNIAYTFKKLNRLSDAMPYYQRVLEKSPDHSEAHFSLGLAYLLTGNFELGWPEYEWRWKKNEGLNAHNFDKPLWDGSDLHGKIIYIYAEQGLGDTFQFLRYAKYAHDRGGYVVFAAQKQLVDFLKLCPYLDIVVPVGHIPSRFDYHAPLMSLPLLLKHYHETDFPCEIPYLHADPELVEQWRITLRDDHNFKIGICWQGNPNYSTAFLRAAVAAKSMHLNMFEPLAHLPNVSVYSLQFYSGTEQIEQVSPAFKKCIHFFDDDFDKTHGRFMDTAAVIKNLDLVISIDTSIAHFAAGLGTPTWNLLPNPPDWRWMLNRADSPWYPNMRLFRQPEPGNWEPVIKQIVQELKKQL